MTLGLFIFIFIFFYKAFKNYNLRGIYNSLNVKLSKNNKNKTSVQEEIGRCLDLLESPSILKGKVTTVGIDAYEVYELFNSMRQGTTQLFDRCNTESCIDFYNGTMLTINSEKVLIKTIYGQTSVDKKLLRDFSNHPYMYIEIANQLRVI